MTDSESLRDFSKAVFGNRRFLEVAAAVAEEKVFYVRAVAERLGFTDNLVQASVRRLEQGGLIRRLGKVKGQAAIYYELVEHEFWNLIRKLVPDPPRSGRLDESHRPNAH